MAASLKSKVVARAGFEGFDSVRVLKASAAPDRFDQLKTFVEAGHHGTMAWLEETIDRRHHPRALWGEVNSIIMLGLNYAPERNPLERLKDASLGNISVYAQHRDYHDIIKGRLKQLAGWLVSEAGGEVKVFVDTAPVMEKPLAQAAGLGWQGKHTNLVSREYGSWLFLGAIFTTLDLAPDEAEVDHCGSCRACLDVCPTKAFPAPYQIDARRCISYLTIEHKGAIAHELRSKMGNRIYGCDDCLAVCPWNKFAVDASEIKLKARAEVRDARLMDLLKLEDASFRSLFSGSPVKRIGVDRFLRNCLIAAGNSGDQALLKPVIALLEHQSPIVRGAAVWAFGQLAPFDAVEKRARICQTQETDQAVLAEWQYIMSGGKK